MRKIDCAHSRNMKTAEKWWKFDFLEKWTNIPSCIPAWSFLAEKLTGFSTKIRPRRDVCEKLYKIVAFMQLHRSLFDQKWLLMNYKISAWTNHLKVASMRRCDFWMISRENRIFTIFLRFSGCRSASNQFFA